jgi:hypothetical protein
MTTVKTVEKNYSDAQEAQIVEAAKNSPTGKINAEIAESLAETMGRTPASIRMKAVRLGIYQAKEKTTKSGGKVETREDVANEICTLLGKNFNGLDNAPKLALQAIRDRLAA